MHIVINSRDNRHFEMITCEHLGWLVDEDVALLVVGANVVLDLIEVGVRGPAVDIDDGEEEVVHWDHHLGELLLQMLRTP